MAVRTLLFVGVITVSWPVLQLLSQETHQEHVAPLSNLEIMQQSVQQIMNEMLGALPLVSTGDSILVRVQPHPESWIVEQALAKALRASRFVVFSLPDSTSSTRYVLSVPSVQLNVRYDNMFKDGLFGSKHVEREVSVEFSSDLRNRVSNEILSSGTHSRTYSDTVAVDDVSRIENESISVTHGELPSEAFLDRFIEPFMIIGATGVAIYLLFHIRS